MSYKLTPLALVESSKNTLEPNIVLEIDGLDYVFGVTVTKTESRYGFNNIKYGDDGLIYGGLAELETAKPYISISGTSQNINQQLEPDKGAASSTSTLTVKLVDKNQEVTKLISPSFVLDEILYKDCTLYLGMVETAFPRDYIELFNGKIQSVVSESGAVNFTIAHPEDLKRSEIFQKAETVLVSNFKYFGLELQSLVYQQREDVEGVVSIEYIQGGAANSSLVVVGNTITVTLGTNATAKEIKKLIENNEDANQLTLVTFLKGVNQSTIQVASPLQTFKVDTTIYVDNVQQFLLPYQDVFRTYARINDEIIEYTGIDYLNNALTGCVRASLTSFGASHDAETEVYSFYKLGLANALDLALMLYLSGASEFYASLNCEDVYNVEPFTNNDNSFLIRNVDLTRKYGVTIGDTLTSSGSIYAENNNTFKIVDLVSLDVGTYVIVDAQLKTENTANVLLKFKSRYNVLPDGVGLLPKQVDVNGINKVKNTFTGSIANYEFYLKDTVNSKEFINTQIFLPSALYSLPRKGRVSVGYTSPPLYDEGSKILDIDTVLKPSQIKITRSINQSFYNAIVWKYDEDSVEDKMLKGLVRLSANSINRINSPTKPYVIEAKGLRPSQETLELIDRTTNRFLARYEFAAEQTSVEVPFKVGWTMECGDVCLFGSSEMQISDSSNGTRNFTPRTFEIINKSLNWKTGQIVLQLLDTNYNQGKRYGVFSPSTIIGEGSSLSRIKMQNSFGADLEKEKWSAFIGKQIIIHNEDYSISYTTRLIGFDADETFMLVTPIPSYPASGWQIDAPMYDDLATDEGAIKALYPYLNPTLNIVSDSVDNFTFELSPLDALKVFVGTIVRVHNEDYSVDSGLEGVKVVEIISNVVTIDKDLGFMPETGYKVELIGFVSDKGQPYAYI